MKQYIDLGKEILATGVRKPNRTGIDTIGIHGAMMKFNLANGFPIVTAKQTFWRSSVAEMLAFLRGYTNAKDFEALGTKVWNRNANENKAWLANTYRKGEGDLGPVYGSVARNWTWYDKYGVRRDYDQLLKVVSDLTVGIDDRREIVTHWNPSVFDRIALPSCHLLYQFGIQGDTLNLSMYQRSCDYGLGIPFNIVGYAWLLSVIAQITGYKAGVFTHFLHDVHIYVNHIDGVREMFDRDTHTLPAFKINPDIQTLKDLETWVTLDDFEMVGYTYNPKIKLDMAV